ncbi:MAG: YebC/PmpR family DNA-binding transcriptional regulator [Bacteroidales bacterium]|nr:YebC/PmpR family DNA-binding transcriptional regulator [Bacteroidales bacterium]
MGRAFEYRRAAKEKRWDKMSKVFPKLGKLITIAAREGGPEPETNAKLRHAIHMAKLQNMPKDNIDNAIKRATGKDADTLVELVFEAKGPHGVLLFIECTTDNNQRTVANIRSYLNKWGCGFAPSGSLEFMFSRKAIFELAANDKLNLDELELELIDAGLQEIEKTETSIFLYSDYTDFGSMSKALDEKGIDYIKSSLQRIPNSPVAFSDEQLADIEKLLDKIEDDDDVQSVYTNIE